MNKVLIIGATSSLAFALGQQLAQKGHDLVLFARDESELEKLASDLRIRHDVKVDTICADLETLDVCDFAKQTKSCDTVFMVAGNMGSDDKDDPENIRNVIDTNFTIPSQILGQIANRMEKSGKGSIVVISSVAGDRGRQRNYVYGSAKAGLTAYASGLRNRLNASGVHVMTVKPGFIDTPMTYGMQSPLMAKREDVAASILRALKKKKDSIYVPFFWRYIMLIIKSIPERIFKGLNL